MAVVLADHEVVREIGRGASSVVYEARQLELGGRPVALKVIQLADLDDGALRRFDRERSSLAALSGHEGVVTVFGAGRTAEGWPWISMELMQGSLGGWIAEHGTLGWVDAARAGVVVARALAAAHDAGILHRDIKPENVLYDGAGRARLADFGIASVGLSATTTKTTMKGFTGTVLHAAPELLAGGTPSEASDIYGLGSSLFALVAGRAPHARVGEDNLLALLGRIATAPIPDLRNLGAADEFASLIERCLATEPSQRPATAHELVAGLQALLDDGRDVEFRLPVGLSNGAAAAVSGAPTIHSPIGAPGNATVLNLVRGPQAPIDSGPSVASAGSVVERPQPLDPTSARWPRHRAKVLVAAVLVAIIGLGGGAFALIGGGGGEEIAAGGGEEIAAGGDPDAKPTPDAIRSTNASTTTSTSSSTTTTAKPPAPVLTMNIFDGQSLTSAALPDHIAPVGGTVEVGATLTVNDLSIPVAADGSWRYDAKLNPGENLLVFVARKTGQSDTRQSYRITLVMSETGATPLPQPAPGVTSPTPAGTEAGSPSGPSQPSAPSSPGSPTPSTPTPTASTAPPLPALAPDWGLDINPLVVGQTGTFTATGTVDSATGFLWDWGYGGRTSSGAVATYAWPEYGSFTVRLTVSRGAESATKTYTVVVNDGHPTATLSGPDTIRANVNTFFSTTSNAFARSGTWSDNCNPPQRPNWSPGDGFGGTWDPSLNGSSCTLSLTVYNATGQRYTVSKNYTVVA
ncbi:MAG: protein kinase domain-containing protein [Acidimicrobiales bacterium]